MARTTAMLLKKDDAHMRRFSGQWKATSRDTCLTRFAQCSTGQVSQDWLFFTDNPTAA
jgi:hypothetical protein